MKGCTNVFSVLKKRRNLMSDTVTITKKEYDYLINRSKWLSAFYDAGVYNWSGFDRAINLKMSDSKEQPHE